MFDGQPKEIIVYATADGAEPFTKWRKKLGAANARARTNMRLDRLRLEGNPGFYREVGQGLYELKLMMGQASAATAPLPARNWFCFCVGATRARRRLTASGHRSFGGIINRGTNHEKLGRSSARELAG